MIANISQEMVDWVPPVMARGMLDRLKSWF